MHYDLAWNPTRHEQREGRVDRFGQKSPQVRVVTIYGSDNGIDRRVLEVLVKKHRSIREATGISVPVPDETSSKVTDAIVEWLLLRGKGQQQALFGDEQVTLFDLDEIVSTKPAIDHTRYHSYDELKEQGLKHLRDAVALLGDKATPQELDDYRHFVIHLADKVAHAHREHDGDSEGVSDAERAAVASITEALGATTA